MDINGVKEYGKLMDKMQVAYTNLVATMEWEPVSYTHLTLPTNSLV